MSDDRLLVAVDVDGTLVNTEMNDLLRGPEIQALHAVREAGHVVALCTGRSMRSADAVIRTGEGCLDGAPQILLNGALVLGEGDLRVLRNGGLPRHVAAELVVMFRDAGTMPMTFDMEHDGGDVHIEKAELNPVLTRYVDRRREQVGRVDEVDDLVAAMPDWVQEVGTIDLVDKARTLADGIKARFGDEVWVVSTQTLIERERYQWIEVMPPFCNKGTGLTLLADDMGVPRERIVAIGDNYNDLDMFAVAGHSVAMGNAPADVQSAVDRVAPHVASNGAAAILEEIARGEWPLREVD